MRRIKLQVPGSLCAGRSLQTEVQGSKKRNELHRSLQTSAPSDDALHSLGEVDAWDALSQSPAYDDHSSISLHRTCPVRYSLVRLSGLLSAATQVLSTFSY
jgi:hypothetical protein